MVFLAVAHHAPTNRGDSGGPVVNNDGELVGIVSQGTTGGAHDREQVTDHSVHVQEIRRALEGMQLPAADRITMKMSVDSAGFDSFYLNVIKNEPIQLKLQGKGTTDLDLFAKDLERNAKRNLVGGKTIVDFLPLLTKAGDTDNEEGEFTPDWSGNCLVQVQNLGGNQTVNEYTLTIQRKSKLPGPFTVIRRLSPGGVDTVQLPYIAGKGKARVSLRGDGDMNLDLFVLGPGNTVVAKGVGPTDHEEVVWTPQTTGIYTIRIESKNPIGDRATPIWSQYVLTTD
jgi:hypothetical protein